MQDDPAELLRCGPCNAGVTAIDLRSVSSSDSQGVRLGFRADYRVGRSKVLIAFSDRDRIYRTPAMHDWLETTARRNLATELADLLESK
jgi:hypothetical protein